MRHPTMTGRLIAVGDIHGCHAEFEELLGQLELTSGDRLVLLGDLVNRRPQQPEGDRDGPGGGLHPAPREP